MSFKKTLALMLVALLALTAVSVVGVAGAQGALGSADNPIQVYFVPSVEAQVLVQGGEVLRQALTDATGLTFEVHVPTSYASTVEAMCAQPDASMGFIPAAGYVIANNRCGVQVKAAAVRFGWPVYWAEYIVRRDAPIYVFNDLNGKTWGYGDVGSTSGYIVPSVEMKSAGITPGNTVETGGHNQTVLAVYNGDVDFGTTFFSPPLMPGGAWSVGDLPEPYDLSVDQSYVTTDNPTKLFVGDIRILDARANVRDQAPDIVDKVRILRISAPIPNDTMSFGPDFPDDLRQQIFDALVAFSGTDQWAQSALGSPDGYNWSSLAEIQDSVFDSVRLQFQILGLTEHDIFGD